VLGNVDGLGFKRKARSGSEKSTVDHAKMLFCTNFITKLVENTGNRPTEE